MVGLVCGGKIKTNFEFRMQRIFFLDFLLPTNQKCHTKYIKRILLMISFNFVQDVLVVVVVVAVVVAIGGLLYFD